jgi:hypothetical protein
VPPENPRAWVLGPPGIARAERRQEVLGALEGVFGNDVVGHRGTHSIQDRRCWGLPPASEDEGPKIDTKRPKKWKRFQSFVEMWRSTARRWRYIFQSRSAHVSARERSPFILRCVSRSHATGSELGFQHLSVVLRRTRSTRSGRFCQNRIRSTVIIIFSLVIVILPGPIFVTTN